jgi:FkbM family methyltransferase
VFAARHQLTLTAKKWLFGRRGEPYRIGDKTLRFVPGTRPVRLRYQTAQNGVNRFDALQLAWLLTNLRAGDFAIDVGANTGQCAIVMAERCGDAGRVIAFEPNPHARQLLDRNFELNPSVKRATVESLACADVAGQEVEMYDNGNTSNSALVRFSDEAVSGGSFRVRTTTLDGYLAERHVPEPRCVKIDTEGAEIRILQGAQNLLSSKAAILCELHPYAWPLFGNSLQQLQELLAKHGRRMRYLDRESYVENEVDYGIVALERA